MHPLIFTKQFGQKKIIDTAEQDNSILSSTASLQSLIDSQQSIGSATGYYLFKHHDENFCFVLSEDQKLANKMSLSVNHDVYTVDLFPIDYSAIDIISIMKEDQNQTTLIRTDNGNFFYFVAKGQDALDTLKFIEMHKRRSYSMQNSWQERKLKI